MDLSVRERLPADVPALVALLEAQQPASGYPLRWPLPFPVEQFLVRTTEEQAWVAELGSRLDGPSGARVVGHVTTARVEPGQAASLLADAAGVERERLASVSVLFVDETVRGAGVGGRLLDHAVARIRDQDRVPVLDVVSTHSPAVELYRRRGWVEVARIRPDWLPDHQPDVLLMRLPTDA